MSFGLKQQRTGNSDFAQLLGEVVFEFSFSCYFSPCGEYPVPYPKTTACEPRDISDHAAILSEKINS